MIEDLIKQLNEQVGKIPELKKLNHTEKDFKQWKLEIESILQKCPYMTANPVVPELIKRFEMLNFFVLRLRMPGEPMVGRRDLERYKTDLVNAEIILKQILKELQDPAFYPKPKEEKPRMGF